MLHFGRTFFTVPKNTPDNRVLNALAGMSLEKVNPKPHQNQHPDVDVFVITSPTNDQSLETRVLANFLTTWSEYTRNIESFGMPIRAYYEVNGDKLIIHKNLQN